MLAFILLLKPHRLGLSRDNVQRLQGKEVVFVTGTDEHGEKIATSAAAANRNPKEHCDVVAEDYRALWKDVGCQVHCQHCSYPTNQAFLKNHTSIINVHVQLGIAYDRFVRTTEGNHEKIVSEFYKRVSENGDIYRAKYEGLYCVNCEEYKVSLV